MAQREMADHKIRGHVDLVLPNAVNFKLRRYRKLWATGAYRSDD
jgi:hypothetical protein